MSALSIVDTHVHLTDPARLSYPWQADVPKLDRPFLPADYQAATGDLDVTAMVFVEVDTASGQEVEEVAWVSELATDEARIRGIVARAPLEKGEGVRALLDELHTYPLVRGIRRIYQAEPDLDFCLRPGFIEGVRALAHYGFSFDICMNWRYMDQTIRFAGQCDNVPMVLDHIGKPDIVGGKLDPWRGQMRELARLPHVTCKISGVATEADHDNWTVEQLRPFILESIEIFGFDRVMFGGDWPVATLAIDYPRWVDVLLEVLADVSDEERGKLFHDNGAAFYRLAGTT